MERRGRVCEQNGCLLQEVATLMGRLKRGSKASSEVKLSAGRESLNQQKEKRGGNETTRCFVEITMEIINNASARGCAKKKRDQRSEPSHRTS